jgi:hypothetical protein
VHIASKVASELTKRAAYFLSPTILIHLAKYLNANNEITRYIIRNLRGNLDQFSYPLQEKILEIIDTNGASIDVITAFIHNFENLPSLIQEKTLKLIDTYEELKPFLIIYDILRIDIDSYHRADRKFKCRLRL